MRTVRTDKTPIDWLAFNFGDRSIYERQDFEGNRIDKKFTRKKGKCKKSKGLKYDYILVGGDLRLNRRVPPSKIKSIYPEKVCVYFSGGKVVKVVR